jgi:DNA-binding beta-propeller fold protein YncE
MICMDLLTDKVIWEKTYDTGCDRMAITPDGKQIYTPSGWWTTQDHCWMVIDGMSGDEIKRIPVKGPSHNTLTSLDGRFAYLASRTTLAVVNTSNNEVVHEITPIGATGVFPFTVNGAGTRGYVCLGNQVGFDIADLTTGKVLGRVLADKDGKQTPQRRRTHGAGLTPDEKEIWISDQADDALYVFDATQDPPKQTHRIDIHNGAHGWVAFSLDGKYAYCSSPDIIDAATKKIIGTFKDEKGQNVSSSKYVEVHFKDGDVVRVGDQFGVGRKR